MLNFKFLYIRAMLLMVTFLFWNSSYAQELKVIVRDAEGKPLPAASVSISNKKAITDQSGQIIFNKVEYPAKLMVSYVGFISIDTTLS
ncbi:MAG: carboxypeptidase-like regulatory domain-containing protein, partial [Saprospiraceae bacterium]